MLRTDSLDQSCTIRTCPARNLTPKIHKQAQITKQSSRQDQKFTPFDRASELNSDLSAVKDRTQLMF